MKYFLDTEFIESFHKPLFGKRRHFIDLISMGIVCEDGRQYYAISKEYNYHDADTWVKENVIGPAYIDVVHGDARNMYDANNFHKYFGISNKQIATDIISFCNPAVYNPIPKPTSPIEFYGYYSDYDWVLFCSLFGRMIDLPKGFPMYCRDLKQMFDEKYVGLMGVVAKKHNNYPKYVNEHNALADARWNMQLYNFIRDDRTIPSISADH